VGVITEIGPLTKIKLKMPICAEPGERAALSRQVAGRWRLVGWGEIIKG
jgi:translation initiation factor 2 subunit 3